MTDSPAQPPPLLSLRSAALLGLLSVLAAVVMAALLRLGDLPYGTRNWAWVVNSRPWGRASLFALLGMLLLALLIFEWVRATRPPSRRVCTWLLLGLLPLALVVEGGIVLSDPLFPVEAPLIVMSDVSNGYYSVAAQASGPAELFSGDLQRTQNMGFPDRVRTHPPGPILFMWAVRQAVLPNYTWLPRLDAFLQRVYGISGEALVGIAWSGTARRFSASDALAACVIGWLLTVLPTLIFLPAYGLGAVLVDRRVGLAAAALSLAVPSLWSFLPGIDGLGAVIALTALYLWAVALRNGDWWRYALAGFGVAVMLLWSYGYVALAPVAFFLAWRRRGESRPQNLAAGLVFALAAFALVYGVLDAAWGYNLWRSMQAAFTAQHQIMVREQRDYLTWLWLNPYAFLLFLGPAVWPGMVASWFSRQVQQGYLARLTQGVLLTLLGLVLIGSTRGEVERIWVFMMPLLAVPLAVLLTRLPKPLALWLPAVILVAQIAFTLFLTRNFVLVTAA